MRGGTQAGRGGGAERAGGAAGGAEAGSRLGSRARGRGSGVGSVLSVLWRKESAASFPSCWVFLALGAVGDVLSWRRERVGRLGHRNSGAGVAGEARALGCR